jgi:hypothetical protein
MKTNDLQPNPDQWKRLLNAWPHLHAWQRKTLVLQACWLVIPRLKPPVIFAVRASFAIFALLLIMPYHPMSIPTAVGGGLAFALITH